MDMKLDSTQTSLNISENVICTIANETLRELDGIYSLAPLPAKTDILSAAGIKPQGRPVRITFVSESASIDVGVVVNLNFKIREAAEQVQSAVKDAVQDMTGITVSKVNVYITGIHFKSDTE